MSFNTYQAPLQPTIAVIGAGNMGQAIIQGLINNNYPADKLWLTNPNLSKIAHLTNNPNLNISTNNALAIQKADIIILAIKPQILRQVIADLSSHFCQKHTTVVSLAPGISLAQLAINLPQSTLIRAMPNIASCTGSGVAALYTESPDLATKNTIDAIFSTLGVTIWLEKESALNAVTAISGSGPAYFFILIEALIAAGEHLGLSRDLSSLLANHTAYGAGKIVTNSTLSATQWREKVTSPNGTTAAAIAVLQQGGIYQLIDQAVIAAHQRAQELAS